MARICYIFVVALITQSSLTLAEDDHEPKDLEGTTSRDILSTKPETGDEVVKDFRGAHKDWMDMFMMPGGNMYPTSSAALMAHLSDSDKTPEEQLEDIKQIANKITLAIQSELANLLSYALTACEKDIDENGLRKKRSAENPMDSTQLVMRLLKHIKSNNEYQNIAIEKMMSAQEIADKFGIEFNPDTEILSDLAFAANEQAKEMTSLLKDAVEAKNATKEIVEFVPIEDMCPLVQSPTENNTYYTYSVHQPEEDQEMQQTPFAPYEYAPQQIHIQPNRVQHNHEPATHIHPHHHIGPQYYPHEAPHYSAPVSPKPSFFDSMMGFTPAPEFYHPYFPEPVTTTTTIILPIDEVVEPEPELVGEEFEEIISSKVIVEADEEPGSATVNHVMTYTLSEKAHFKAPEIQKMPQQMQYTFFLM